MTLWLSPHAAVVLGVDAAETSGWSIVCPAKQAGRVLLHSHGVAKTHAEIDRAVSTAHDLALDRGLPFVVSSETWSPRGWTPTTYGAVREAWGRWRHALDRSPELELVGGDEPPIVLRVLCATWRSQLGLRPVFDAEVLARPKKGQQRAAWKRSAVLAVHRKFGEHVTDDEAEATCLALWGAHSQELADVLAPKRRRSA